MDTSQSLFSSMGDHTWKVLARDDPGDSSSRGTPACSFLVRKYQGLEDCLLELEECPCVASAPGHYKRVVQGNLYQVDHNFFVPCPGFAHGIIWLQDLIREINSSHIPTVVDDTVGLEDRCHGTSHRDRGAAVTVKSG